MNQKTEDYYNLRPNGGDKMKNWFDLKRVLQYSYVNLPERPRILDLGCASGIMAAMMAEEINAMVVGVDFSFARIKRGIEHRNELVFFQMQDVFEYCEETIKTTQRFNVVTIFDLLEHVNAPIRLIDLALKVLLPGGIIIARVPKDRVDPAHVWLFKTQEDFHLHLQPTRSFEYDNGLYGVWE